VSFFHPDFRPLRTAHSGRPILDGARFFRRRHSDILLIQLTVVVDSLT